MLLEFANVVDSLPFYRIALWNGVDRFISFIPLASNLICL